MKNGLKIKLPPRKQRLVYYQIYLIFFMYWLKDVLHFPSAITYLTDVITIYLFITRIKSISRNIKASGAKRQLNIFGIILGCIIIGALLNFVDPLLFIWGLRNNIRFFAFFFICLTLLYDSDLDRIFRFITVMFWMNVVMSSFQYFVMGVSGDYLGGFFGVTQGCNTYVNILICFISSFVLSQYFHKKTSLLNMGVTVVACLYLATLAELKIFYVEFIVIFLVAILIQKPTLKTGAFIISGVIMMIVGVQVILEYNPEILNFFFNQNAVEFYLSGNGYTNSGDLNRFTAIQQIYEKFFEGDFFHSIFGFGLGNCEYAQFSFLQSDFYLKYSYLHYRWFTHAWVYLEQGALGIILLVVFFVSIALFAIKNKNISQRPELMMTSILFLPTCFIGLIYNSALQMESAYIIALICAIPFILYKNKKI